METTALHQTIFSVFNDGEACSETLKNINIAGISPSAGEPVGGLKNKSGTVVVNSGKINNLLEVGFTLKNPSVPGTGVRSGNVDVEVVVKKLSSAVTMGKVVTKTIPLTVEVDASGRLINCRSSLDSKALAIKSDAKLEAKREMCASMGGTWNAPNCSIANLFQANCQSMGGQWDSANKKCRNLLQKNCQDMGGAWDASAKKCSIDNILQPLRDSIVSFPSGKNCYIHSACVIRGPAQPWETCSAISANPCAAGFQRRDFDIIPGNHGHEAWNEDHYVVLCCR